jgi:hypothetical protein
MEREVADFNFLQVILKNGHYYYDAPEGSEQKMAYDLGQETRDKILAIIDKVKAYNPYQ